MSQQQIDGSAPPTCAAPGCGFFGSPATLGMCSVCYKQHCCTVTETDSPGAATAFNPFVAGSAAAAKPTTEVAAPTPTPTPGASVCLLAPAKCAAAEAGAVLALRAPEAAAKKKNAAPGRCAACSKKVGLTGFVCRCGDTFCGSHRYAEEHGCSFDFKGASRDAIARANPVVKAEKLTGKI